MAPRGQTGPKRTRKAVVLRPTRPPRPPAELGEVAAGKWRETAATLAEAGLLTLLDLDVLRLYAETWERWTAAGAAVAAAGGEYYATAGGLYRRHPAAIARDQHARDLAALAEKLALTPASRRRLRLELPGADEPGGVLQRQRTGGRP